jgi:alpha-ketoglutarate-dependent taurine dioxygenase
MGIVDQHSIERALNASGWCWLPPAAVEDPLEFLRLLGPKVTAKRGGPNHHELRPYTRENAPLGSMSAMTGTDAQPRHTDAAYVPEPPRYTVLQCLAEGERPCPTWLWPMDTARLRKDRPHELTDPIWVVQGGGYGAFYCTAMDVHDSAVRLRYDPLCMRSIVRHSETVAAAEAAIDNYSIRAEVVWESGAILIVDNWICLHARGDGAASAPYRRLRRWYIGAHHGLGT